MNTNLSTSLPAKLGISPQQFEQIVIIGAIALTLLQLSKLLGQYGQAIQTETAFQTLGAVL